MANIEEFKIEHIDGAETSFDGQHMLLHVAGAGGTKACVALPQEQLLPLIDLAANSYAQGKKIRQDRTELRAFHRVTWWEIGTPPEGGDAILSLTFGAGGTLSFQLTQQMLRGMHETISVLLGAPSAAPAGTSRQ